MPHLMTRRELNKTIQLDKFCNTPGTYAYYNLIRKHFPNTKNIFPFYKTKMIYNNISNMSKHYTRRFNTVKVIGKNGKTTIYSWSC